MPIPKPFTDIFNRMKEFYLQDESLISFYEIPNQVIAELSDDELFGVVTALRDLGVTFWVHFENGTRSTMTLAGMDMPVDFLRENVAKFFAHFMGEDEELDEESERRTPGQRANARYWLLKYPFGAPELSFGLPGYNC